MSAIVILYVAILVAVAALLLVAYRVLGTPSRLAPTDYTTVLADVIDTVGRSARRLREALDSGTEAGRLEQVAAETRKIFQTGYYQALRLRPASGGDAAVSVRQIIGAGCEAYDWASRMIGSASARNPVILEEARRLLDAGDRQLAEAARELALRTPAAT